MTRSTEPEASDNPCERAEPLLSAYLLEELSGDEREAVADHVAACARCREDLEMLGGAASALRSIPPLEAGLEPADRERLLSAARQSAASARGPRSRVLYLALGGLAAAAVLAVALIPGLVPWGRGKEGVQLARAPQPLPSPAMAGEDARPLQKLPLERTPAPVEKLAADGRTAPARGLASGMPDASRDGALVEKRLEAVQVDVMDRQTLDEREVTLFARGEGAKGRAYGFSPPGEPAGEASSTGVRLFNSPDRFDAPTRGETGIEAAAEQAPSTRARFGEALVKRKAGASSAGGIEGAADPLGTSEEKFFEALEGEGLRPGKKLEAGLELAEAARGATASAADPEAPARRYRSATPDAEAPRAQGERRGRLSVAAPGDKPAEEAPAALAGAEPAGAVLTDPAAAPTPPTPVAPANQAPGGAPAAATRPTTTADHWKVRVDDFLSRLDRRAGETPDMMFFRYWGTNPFVEASADPLSTFAVDVDTASYTLARAYLYQRGILPPREAIRTEEFINFFRSRYAPPAADGPAFAIHAEMAPSPFAHEADYQILKVGLKGREVPREKRKVCSLVFVIDTSGSMRRENRLELVKDALRLLVPELDEGDTIGIVAFDREARVVLDPVPASEKERILDAISRLEPRQNTNVAAGLELGYQMAARHMLKDGSNRVILLSDGVANTGNVDPAAMTEGVRAQREQGIYLTCVGVGMGNMNDALMESLANRGNGQCVYVDRIEEARKAFVENLTGTLEAIARDVKIQVELDPAKVIRYRLLGYENRDVADADFRNNEVDAGEVGAGHEVTALYELKLKPDAAETLATIRVRYLTVDHGEAVEIARPVTSADRRTALAEASPRFQVSASAAELAEILRGSYWARGSTLDRVAAILEPLLGAADGPGARLGDDTDVVELVALVKKADALVREREARTDDVARVSDAIKENHLLRARVEDALRARSIESRAQLDDILRQNQMLRQRLEELLRQ